MFYQLRKLKENELKKLNDWLKLQNLEMDKETRCRFSDVWEVAKLMKNLHRKLIHTNHYNRSTTMMNKFENWKIFNNEVLTKLDMAHTKSALEQLAEGKKGAIESLLYDLITMGKSRRSTTTTTTTRSVSADSPRHKSPQMNLLTKSLTRIPVESLVLYVDQVIDGRTVKVAKRHVAYEDYLAALKELERKDAYIEFIEKSADFLLKFTKANHEKFLEIAKQFQNAIKS